jgi:release factor glutamine methyltransferase
LAASPTGDMMKFLMSALLWRMRRHRHPYDISYRGETIKIFPGVFSPKYDYSAKVAVDSLPALNGRSFLEIGCGCGMISVFAAIRGARLVVASDISPIAASNTKFNFDARRLADAHVIQGDLLEALSYKFDLVLFNPPYFSGHARDWLERSVYDENYEILKRFIADVKRCLAVDGNVMLGFPKSGEQQLLDTELQRAGLKVMQVKEFGIRGFGCKYFTLRAN